MKNFFNKIKTKFNIKLLIFLFIICILYFFNKLLLFNYNHFNTFENFKKYKPIVVNEDYIASISILA